MPLIESSFDLKGHWIFGGFTLRINFLIAALPRKDITFYLIDLAHSDTKSDLKPQPPNPYLLDHTVRLTYFPLSFFSNMPSDLVHSLAGNCPHNLCQAKEVSSHR